MTESTRLRPRMMLFTLYGDYIYHRGGEIWVGSLIRLLKCFGITEQSIRSELVRMCRKGYLEVRRCGKRSYYSLSARGRAIIETGARRIFAHDRGPWDGQWTILTYSIPEAQREARDRLRRDLTWLGFGPLTPGVYISPWPHEEDLPRLVQTFSQYGYVQVFRARNRGPEDDRQVVARAWDLGAVGRAYQEFIDQWEPELRRFRESGGAGWSDEDCFVQRYLLAHAYEDFPLIDPGLPRELLPAEWVGERATALFREYHEALREGAMRFFDSIYEGWPMTVKGGGG